MLRVSVAVGETEEREGSVREKECPSHFQRPSNEDLPARWVQSKRMSKDGANWNKMLYDLASLMVIKTAPKLPVPHTQSRLPAGW